MDALIAKLEQIDFASLDIDQVLDKRDSDPFDCEWMRVYGEIEALKEEKGYSADDKKYSSTVRENVFKIVFKRSGNGDFAGYLSDDFGLIADGGILNYSDPWLGKLGRF